MIKLSKINQFCNAYVFFWIAKTIDTHNEFDKIMFVGALKGPILAFLTFKVGIIGC
jgi:hypothetical protein